LVKWFGGIPMKGMSVSKWEMKKLFHVTVKEVYASIEADLIYASENLAALPSQKNKRELHWHF
jgi:hypothetical protein